MRGVHPLPGEALEDCISLHAESEDCSEPDGNELIQVSYAIGWHSAHIVMIAETGQCPWCGRTERVDQP